MLTWPRACAPGRPLPPPTRRAKRSAGVADFDDLIAWTRRLLDKPGMGEWVRYKLDRRTDHILVDEAQDTNARAMGDRRRRWPAEYFSGMRAKPRARCRTLFMVGDFKQAIFGFQGTDPQRIQARPRMGAREVGRVARGRGASDDGRALALEFRDLSIDASFRSAPAVLDVVDAVIAEVGFDAMGLPERPNRHRAHFDRPARPRRAVEAVRCSKRPKKAMTGEEGWLDDGRPALRRRRLAKQVQALARRGAGPRLDQAAAERRATS